MGDSVVTRGGKGKKREADKQRRAERRVTPRRDLGPERPRLKRKLYEKELARLQGELVKVQLWVKRTGAKVVVVFEGRDAAGKAV